MRIQRFQATQAAVTTVAALTLLFTTVTPVSAQRANTVGQNGRSTRQRMSRPAPTLATVPVTAMTPYFGLTDDQAKRIAEIQKTSRPDMSAMADQFRQMQQTGQRPTQEQISQIRQQVQTARATMEANRDIASQEIGLVLTSAQRPAIGSFLRDVELFQQVDLPLELIKPLDLNGPQKRKLQVIADQVEQERYRVLETLRARDLQRRTSTTPNGNSPDNSAPQQQWQSVVETLRKAQDKMREEVMKVLTPTQAALVTTWEKEHPETNRGFGRGG